MTKTPRKPAATSAPKSAVLLPARPFGRRLADILESRVGGKLRPAEQKLLRACRWGEFAIISDTRPDVATPDNTIGADFLRFLILGGDEENPVHEQGLQVKGAWIEGDLDLENIETSARIGCFKCHFAADILVHNARLHGVYLNGTRLLAFTGDGLVTQGDLFFNGDFEAKGAVRLLGAQIGGDLVCNGGKFLAKQGFALSCERMVVKGGVFFQDGFEAKGAVRLLGAQIDGNLECDGGKFFAEMDSSLTCDGMTVKGSVFLRNEFQAKGAVRLVGAEIGGGLDCSGGKFSREQGDALSCDKVTVKGALFLRQGTTIAGALNLVSAQVGNLIDEPACWPDAGKLILNGFSYDRFGGDTPSTDRRGDWLMLQGLDHTTDFRPQPWRQAIKVLREMGHEAEADKLAVRFNQERYKHSKSNFFFKQFHRLYGLLFGYGYKPLWSIGVFLGISLLCGLFYHYAATKGVFAPSNPLVFQNPTYAPCSPGFSEAHDGETGRKVGNWYWCDAVPGEYTTFQPYWYSLDVILPIIDLQQEKDWGPYIDTPPKPELSSSFDTLKASAGYIFDPSTWTLRFCTRLLIWLQTLYGWVCSIVFVAMFTGLARKEGAD